jgi:hypothetical protein
MEFANHQAPARPSDHSFAHHRVARWKYRSSTKVVRSEAGRLHRGYLQGDPVYGPGTCLPVSAQLWIESPLGCRRVDATEWWHMKGFPKDSPPIPLKFLFQQPGVHLWAAIGDKLLQVLHPGDPVILSPETTTPALPQRLFSPKDTQEWSWSPPSFKKRGRWHRERVSKLRTACTRFPDSDTIFQEGLAILESHRQNYTSAGPKHLVLLWWEWPPEYHEELRTGLSMNFLSTPEPGIKQNARMTESKRAIAKQFVDELVLLGVLEPEPYPGNAVNTCPLFLVPKPGQPGEYQCIADMKKRGQNAVVGADPVQMSSPADILPRLYTDGYSATLDITKFFHMFLTREDERQYLGCIHPTTGVMLRYKTLPMGAGNSPGASGRFGAIFVRLIRETLPAFQGTPMQNDYAGAFAGAGYHPHLGIGRVIIGLDGLPACIIWIHVDDLLIHGPSYEKCLAGLIQVLELSVKLGFICQQVKTVPPCQSVKYCGFIYETAGIPTMKIPEDKISRALSQTSYVLRPDTHLSRIGLAITIGNLQSLVPATPNNIGASFLRHAYNSLHATRACSCLNYLEFYSEENTLSTLSQLDLKWWFQALHSGLSSSVQVQHTAHLGVSWGDGSGSGTGGPFEWVSPDKGPHPTMCTWMGTWSPTVHHYSSNWRELRTLVATLSPTEQGIHNVRDVHLFYFTDNSTVYNITRSGSSPSPKLHELVQTLKLLELRQGCRLDVVHVPGTTMITQGTDGQSRGLWVSPLAQTTRDVTADLFRPAPPSDLLMHWLLKLTASPFAPEEYHWESDLSSWHSHDLIHHHCLWTLSPTIARQGMMAAVFAWIESPSDSSHFFLIPRLLQREFGRVNKHILLLGQFMDAPLPPDFSPLVPFVVFYLSPFQRHTKRLDNSPWLDEGSKFSCPEWVRTQMEYLRGLSGTHPARDA